MRKNKHKMVCEENAEYRPKNIDIHCQIEMLDLGFLSVPTSICPPTSPDRFLQAVVPHVPILQIHEMRFA